MLESTASSETLGPISLGKATKPIAADTTVDACIPPAAVSTLKDISVPESDGEIWPTKPFPTPRAPGPAWGDSHDPWRRLVIGTRPRVLVEPWRCTSERSYVPDTVLDAARVGRLEVRAVSTRGDGHRYEGTVRQDAMSLGTTDDKQWVLAAVADGVGSSLRSELGSQKAVQVGLDGLRSEISRNELDADFAVVFAQVRVALEHLSQAEGLDPLDLSTTLSLAAVRTQGEKGGACFVAACIGDSPVLLLAPDAVTTVLSEAAFEGGADQPLTTATRCLPSYQLPRVAAGHLSKGQTLIVATDGVANALFADPDVRQHVANGWRNNSGPGPAEFAWRMQFAKKSHDDDRTAVAIWLT
jgi:serine/threonine protein phosphatase PrpC